MIEFASIEKYKENNRIEAKRAVGGLPHSIWETYSAFANTLGGIILLGVEERPDKSLHPVKLPYPEGLIEDFFDILNDPKRVSANILSEGDVTLEEIDGKPIVAIRVPRARRCDKPIYVEGNPFLGSYRRNGEGDYKCTREEVLAMLRDAEIKSRDMTVVESMSPDVLSRESIEGYRNALAGNYDETSDEELLYKIGAISAGEDGRMHPTAAGLLMFGHEYEIVKEYPQYFLDYREHSVSDDTLEYRLCSSSADWSGNVFDFYSEVSGRIALGIDYPKGDGSDIALAIREALANCLINADYLGRQGIIIIKKQNSITISNPGSFRIDLESAKSGGISDPRNSALVKMFNLIRVGKRMGSGIPNMFSVWKNQGWHAPVIKEDFDPDRITLTLTIGNAVDDADKIGVAEGTGAHRQAVIAYLTERVIASDAEIAELLGLGRNEACRILDEMTGSDIIVAECGADGCVYKLKA